MAIKKVLVAGLGLMGRGILEVCAREGFETIGFDVSEEATQKALGFIESGLDKRIKKGKITEEDKQKLLKNITIVSKLEDAKDVDLAIEAVFEDIQVKQDLFKKLDDILQPNAILASNTSALPATPLASAGVN